MLLSRCPCSLVCFYLPTCSSALLSYPLRSPSDTVHIGDLVTLGGTMHCVFLAFRLWIMLDKFDNLYFTGKETGTQRGSTPCPRVRLAPSAVIQPLCWSAYSAHTFYTYPSWLDCQGFARLCTLSARHRACTQERTPGSWLKR